MGPLQSSSSFIEPAYIYIPDSSSALGTPVTNMPSSSWNYNNTPQSVNVPQVTRGMFVLNSMFFFFSFFVIQICNFYSLFYDDFKFKEGSAKL